MYFEKKFINCWIALEGNKFNIKIYYTQKLALLLNQLQPLSDESGELKSLGVKTQKLSFNKHHLIFIIYVLPADIGVFLYNVPFQVFYQIFIITSWVKFLLSIISLKIIQLSFFLILNKTTQFLLKKKYCSKKEIYDQDTNVNLTRYLITIDRSKIESHSKVYKVINFLFRIFLFFNWYLFHDIDIFW